MKCPTCSQELPHPGSGLEEAEAYHLTEARCRLLEQIQAQRVKVWKFEQDRVVAAVELLGLHSAMDKWEIGVLEMVEKKLKEASP